MPNTTSTSSDRPTATEIIERADALDARRRAQIKNQHDTIDRILGGKGWSYDEELRFLQTELAKAISKLNRIDDAVNSRAIIGGLVPRIKKILGES